MLNLIDVSCGYNKEDVVFNINFQVKQGDFLTILGPNGSGKSTLIKAIGGLIDYKGKILLDNEEVKKYKKKILGQKIAMLNQISDVTFGYTVKETVMLGRYAYMKGIFSTSEEDELIVMDAIKKVAMENFLDRDIGTLSGGQLQRVFLARCFAQEPKILLLDEPTNHLDLTYQIEILDRAKKWAKEKNKVVIAVIHDLNLIKRYSEKVVLLSDGKIVDLGNEDDVLKGSIINQVYKLDISKWMNESLNQWR